MSYSKVQEIESAIKELTSEELEQLCSWLDQHGPQRIDQRIASDLISGHLDAAIQQALKEEWNGEVRSL